MAPPISQRMRGPDYRLEAREEALADEARAERVATGESAVEGVREARLRNASVERLMAPAPDVSAEAGAWRMTGSGVQSRVNPRRGVVEHVQNVGGSVKSWEEAYTPPPVSKKASYADALLNDLPKRVELIRRSLRAGDIPAAEAERAEIERYVDENKTVLRDFARYTGTDGIVAQASERALGFVTGSWLSDEDALLFDPRNNPAAVRAWGSRRGASSDYVALLEGANKGDPEALDVTQRVSGMSAATVRGAQAEREGVRTRVKEAYGSPGLADAAASLLPADESPVSVGNRFSGYYNRAKSLVLAGMPEGVAGASGVGDVLQPLFQAGDSEITGDGLARRVPAFAGVMSSDSPTVARGKLVSASRRLAEYATMFGAEPDQRRLIVPALDAFAAASKDGGAAPTDAVMRGVLSAGVAPVVKRAAAEGRVLDDAAISALTSAELARRTGKTDDSPLARELSRADQFASDYNVRVSSPVIGPTPQAFDDRGQPIPGGMLKDAMYPGLLSQKEALKRASVLAKAELASGRAKTFNDAFRATAVPALRDEFLLQSSQEPAVAEAMADVAVTYMLGKQGGVDLRTLKDDLVRDWGPTANQMAIMNAKETLAFGTKSEKVALYAAEKAQVDRWARLGPSAKDNPEVQLYNTFSAAKSSTGGDFKPGDKVWNETVAGVRTVLDNFVSSAVHSPKGVAGVLEGVTVADVSTDAGRRALSDRIAGAMYGGMHSASSRIAGKLPEGTGRALAKGFADQFVESLVANKKVADSIRAPGMRDAVLSKQFGGVGAFIDAVMAEERVVTDPNIPHTLRFGAAASSVSPSTELVTSAERSMRAVSGAYLAAILSEAVGGLKGEEGVGPAVNAVVRGTAVGAIGATATGALVTATVPVAPISLAAGAVSAAGYIIYRAGLEKLQPVNSDGLGIRLTHYATTFAAAEHVDSSTVSPDAFAGPPIPAYAEVSTPAVSTIPAAFPGSVLQTYGLSPMATREVQRAERSRLTVAMGATGGLVNAPVDALKPGDTLAKAINGLGEVQRNNVRASESAAAPAILETLSRKLDKVSPEVSAGVITVVHNLLGDRSNIPYRELQKFADSAVITAMRKQVERDMANYEGKKKIDTEMRIYLKTEEAKIKKRFGGDENALTAAGEVESDGDAK